MTLTILQMWSGKDWTPLADLLRPNLAEYSERHGYDVIERRTPTRKGPQKKRDHICWRRIDWVQDMTDLLDLPDYYWILDIDVAITNMTIPVTDFLDQEHDVFMCGDANGFNAGSFILRPGSRFTIDWLGEILNLRDEGVATGDQHAMELLAQFNPDLVKMKMLPHPAFNSIPYEHYEEFAGKQIDGDWQPGHLLVHLPGKNNQDRERLLRGYQERVVR